MNLIQVDTSVFLVIALRMDPTWLMDNPVTTNQVQQVLYLCKFCVICNSRNTNFHVHWMSNKRYSKIYFTRP